MAVRYLWDTNIASYTIKGNFQRSGGGCTVTRVRDRRLQRHRGRVVVSTS